MKVLKVEFRISNTALNWHRCIIIHRRKMNNGKTRYNFIVDPDLIEYKGQFDLPANLPVTDKQVLWRAFEMAYKVYGNLIHLDIEKVLL